GGHDRWLPRRRLGKRDRPRETRQGRGERPRRGAGQRPPGGGERERAPHGLPAFFGAGLVAGAAGAAGLLASRVFTAPARSRAQSRSVASGLRLATASYAVSAAFHSCCSSRARPSPASARNLTLPST